jgi:hypothetical protein
VSGPSRLGLGPRALTEDDVRRIIREELERHRTADQPDAVHHVCGLQGYDGMIDPPCPACTADQQSAKGQD